MSAARRCATCVRASWGRTSPRRARVATAACDDGRYRSAVPRSAHGSAASPLTAGAVRLVFFGTPADAVPALEALHGADHEIPLVVTQPDRRRGRGSDPGPSPVK